MSSFHLESRINGIDRIGARFARRQCSSLVVRESRESETGTITIVNERDRR